MCPLASDIECGMPVDGGARVSYVVVPFASSLLSSTVAQCVCA